MADSIRSLNPDIQAPEEEKLGVLFSKALADGKTILNNEWVLMRIEMQEEMKEAAVVARNYVIGGMAIALCIQLSALVLAAILFEVLALPLWASLGIVTVIGLAVAFFFLKKGTTLLKGVNPVPTESINDLSERVSWLVKSRA